MCGRNFENLCPSGCHLEWTISMPEVRKVVYGSLRFWCIFNIIDICVPDIRVRNIKKNG